MWGTTNARTLPLSATGSAGMEASFVNTVHEGDVVVVAVNGLFGQRMCDVAARCGAEVVAVEHEWGTPVDVDRVLSAHPSPAIIAAVHAETSTGVRSDIAALGAGKGDALLVTDAVTSIGGIELRADDWGVDVGYAGTQKCLGVAPGLAPFTINDRAFERRVEKPRSWYLDLGLLGGYVGEASGSGGRTYHHTAPTAMVVSLHAGLGPDPRRGAAETSGPGTPRPVGSSTRGWSRWGSSCSPRRASRLPELTTVKVPDGVDSAAVRSLLLERHNIEIGAGAGPYAATVWRIGLMGHNARPDAALLVLAALRDVLGRVGWTG